MEPISAERPPTPAPLIPPQHLPITPPSHRPLLLLFVLFGFVLVFLGLTAYYLRTHPSDSKQKKAIAALSVIPTAPSEISQARIILSRYTPADNHPGYTDYTLYQMTGIGGKQEVFLDHVNRILGLAPDKKTLFYVGDQEKTVYIYDFSSKKSTPLFSTVFPTSPPQLNIPISLGFIMNWAPDGKSFVLTSYVNYGNSSGNTWNQIYRYPQLQKTGEFYTQSLEASVYPPRYTKDNQLVILDATDTEGLSSSNLQALKDKRFSSFELALLNPLTGEKKTIHTPLADPNNRLIISLIQPDTISYVVDESTYQTPRKTGFAYTTSTGKTVQLSAEELFALSIPTPELTKSPHATVKANLPSQYAGYYISNGPEKYLNSEWVLFSIDKLQRTASDTAPAFICIMNLNHPADSFKVITTGDSPMW